MSSLPTHSERRDGLTTFSSDSRIDHLGWICIEFPGYSFLIESASVPYLFFLKLARWAKPAE